MPNKTFFTYDEQIEKLEKEKQLVISDPEFAKNTLQKLSYFSLIGGYKDLFKHKPSGNYLHGVTFEEITAFYYFDEELRTLFLKYILHVERQLKSMLSYYFCEKYGEQQTAYLTAGNYNYTRRNQSKINRLITTLSKTIALPSNYSYITHHATVYGNVPCNISSGYIVKASPFHLISRRSILDIHSLKNSCLYDSSLPSPLFSKSAL